MMFACTTMKNMMAAVTLRSLKVKTSVYLHVWAQYVMSMMLFPLTVLIRKVGGLLTLYSVWRNGKGILIRKFFKLLSVLLVFIRWAHYCDSVVDVSEW